MLVELTADHGQPFNAFFSDGTQIQVSGAVDLEEVMNALKAGKYSAALNWLPLTVAISVAGNLHIHTVSCC